MLARLPAQVSKLVPRLPALPGRSPDGPSFRPVSVLSPLNSALTKISRFSTKTAALTPLDSVLTDTPSRNPFVIRSYKKHRGVGVFRPRFSRATGHESQVTSFHSLAASLSSLCPLFDTRSLSFQSFAASFLKMPGVGASRRPLRDTRGGG